MKTIIQKHWALIGFLAAFLLDTNYGFIEMISPNGTVAKIIQGFGAIILAYFWQNENQVFKTRGIGGRPDDRNPKKPK